MEKQQSLFKGRDKRKKGWFWMDNEYLNEYGRYFGAIGTAIYVSLCRHADVETQKCFPAIKTIAEENNIGERTVKQYIKELAKYKLILIEKERNTSTQEWLNNTYTLLDKNEWIKPLRPLKKKRVVARGNVRLWQEPGAKHNISQGQRSHLKEDSYIKETHTIAAPSAAGNEINRLIDLFKGVNPNYEILFQNKSQRAAIERMVKKWGYEKMENGIKILPAIVGKRFAPTITTPIQLENKMGDLKQFIDKERSGSNKKVEIV